MGLLPNPWVILAFVLALIASFGGGFVSGEHTGADRVQVAWDQANAVAVQARAKRLEQAQKESAALQAAADEDRRKRDAENKDRDRRLVAALGELRKRPARPGPGGDAHAAPARSEGGGCTGAGLYADDAVLLAGKADLFQRIRVQRDTCYEQYDRAREALGRLKAP